MEKKYDVTALGELLIDFTENGLSKQANEVFEANPGGAPCNVLAMLSKLGKKTAFIGKVGKDRFGEQLTETIQKAGIDAANLLYEETAQTTLSFVHNRADGERDFTFYRHPGADLMLREEEINRDIIGQSKIFHYGTLSMTDEPVKSATKAAIKIARESGCIISFDPNVRLPLWNCLEDIKEAAYFGFQNCDILKIADNELLLLTGKDTLEEGIRELKATYEIPMIFLTLGAEGSCAYYQDIYVREKAISVKSIETTGAGDTFLGCVLSGLLDYGMAELTEQALSEILQFANVAAAIIVTRKGALLSMPTKMEIEERIYINFN